MTDEAENQIKRNEISIQESWSLLNENKETRKKIIAIGLLKEDEEFRRTLTDLDDLIQIGWFGVPVKHPPDSNK